MDKFFDSLLRIANYEDMLPEHMKIFHEEMEVNFAEICDLINHPLAVFMDVYAPYLEGFSEEECEEIKNSIAAALFTMTATLSNATVKKAVEDYRKNQVKTQLYKLWSEKTGGTKNPRVWSEKYRTPILACMKPKVYDSAKRAFSTMNSSTQSEVDIKAALTFLQSADFFEDIGESEFRDTCFEERILGDYSDLFPEISAVRDALESTGISAYEWHDHPAIKSKILSMAAAEYNAGGSDRVIAFIKDMDDAELKKWITDVVRKDMSLGMKIIKNKGE